MEKRRNSFLFIFIFIFFISLTSAAEFDNAISNYDKETETITFSNGCIFEWSWTCMGDEIGEVKLRTPRDFNVPYGQYNYVFEIEAKVYEDYNDFLKGLEYMDMHNGKKTSRELDIKIRSYEKKVVPTYEYECYYDKIEEDELCDKIQNGTKIITKEVWKKVTPADLKKADGSVILRGYTYIEKGDYVDWSAEFFGTRVKHDIWATWSADFLVDNSFYYAFEESSGNAVDSTGNFSTVATGVVYQDTGVIDDAFHYDSENFDRVIVDGSFNWDESAAWTINTWFHIDTLTVDGSIFSTDLSNSDSPRGVLFYIESTDGTWKFNDAGATTILTNVTSSAGDSVILTATYDGIGEVKIYSNGTQVYTVSKTLADAPDINQFTIGVRNPTVKPFDGEIDEFAFWTRELSQVEVTDLIFAIQNGCGYDDDSCFGSSPTINLTSPIDNYNSTITNVDLIATVIDDIYIENVTLYFNGVANETNTSHVNGTYTFNKNIPFGNNNWSILAWNNQSSSTQSETRNINFVGEAPSVVLTSPSNDSYLTSSTVSMISEVIDNDGVKNVSLYFDGLLNETDTSSFNGTYTFTKIVSEGIHNWSILASDEFGLTNQSETWIFNYTQPPLFVNLTVPIDNYNSSINTINMSCLAYSVDGVTQLDLIVNDVINESVYNTTTIQNLTLSKNVVYSDGVYNWKCKATNPFVTVNSTSRTLTVDTTSPVVTITYPVATTYTFNISSLNYSSVEPHSDKCWYSTDGGSTNSTPITPANFTNVPSTEGTNTWTVYCNDTFGFEGSDSVTFERDTLVTTLNSPADDSSTIIGNVVFNATGNSTIGNLLQNMTLWTNETGSWTANETIDLTPTGYEYSGFNFDTGINPYGITTDGTYFYVTEASGSAAVYKYWINGTYTGTSFSVSSETTFPYGITWNGTNFFVVGSENDRIYLYNSAGAYTSTSFDISGQVFSGRGATYDGTYIYVADNSDDQIHKYTTAGIYSGLLLDATAQDSDINSVDWDGTYFWITGDTTKSVYKYYSNGTYTGESFSTSSEDTQTFDIVSNNNYLYTSGLDNDKIYKYDDENPSESTQTFTMYVDDTILWNVETCLTTGKCNFAPANFTLGVDTTPPTVTIEAPTGTIGSGAVGSSETLNFTATDVNLENCWYEYNGANTTIDGCVSGVKNSTTFILADTTKTITVYANDSSGSVSSDTTTWDYLINDISVTYDSPVGESIPNTIVQVISVGGGGLLDSAYLDYNGTNYTTNLNYTGGNYIMTTTAPSPDVVTSKNISFRFVVVVDGTSYNLRENIQFVSLLNFSVCTGGDVLLNISLYDEETKTSINGDLEINTDLISVTTGNSVQSLQLESENTSNVLICLDPINSTEFFTLDAEIRYSSDGYAAELYHIQNGDLGTVPVALSLYDLNESDATEFKVVYQDNTFDFVEGAVIQLQRKYISEDIYKTVEAPLTSDGGVSVVHIDLNSIKYRATVVKNGVVLDEFDNLVFECESELTGECEQKLLGQIDPDNDKNLDNTRDFYYSEPVTSNDTITTTFSVPSGLPASVNVVLEQSDQFGNKSLCNQTIVSSAGSISCNFSETLGDSYISMYLYKNGEIIAKKTYIIHPSSYLNWLGNNYILIFLLLLSLVGMALTSPEWIIINGIVTMVITGGLYLASGLDFVAGLGSIAWLLFAAIILIAKIAKQEDR